ncbi:MAG: Fe-S protein assembly chaperone HscA [Myxococcota bacterium]
MALLQISDPGGRPQAIGIDLGTTHSLVAWVTSTGSPTAVYDCDNEALIPSIVHYQADGGVVVGKPARDRGALHPRDTIHSVKRFMGRGADDPETRRLGPYRFATDEGPVVRFQVAGDRQVTPTEVSAEILRELRNTALEEIGPIGGAVITVPAYFDDSQRQATKDAARLAGIDVLRLLNEPTAAALAYGLDKKQNGTFVVYDLGGGTFDVTVLLLDDGVFQVKATGGDSQLGGDDMDRLLAEHFLRGLGDEDPSPELARAMLDGARAVKHALSDQDAVELTIEIPGGRFDAKVTRVEFNDLVRPLLSRTGAASRRALRDAHLGVDAIDGVILVGGATRTPIVRSYVAELFDKEPLSDIDPDQVVALGAAHQADILAGETPRHDVLLLDVLPLSLGLATMGGVVERILPRNTAIPSAAAQVFTTYADNQTGFELHVVQGERELADDCRSLAHFTLRGIPPMAAGVARLEVKFAVDADGLLEVSAREQRTGIEQTVEVKPSYGLTDEEIEQMLLDAYEHGEADVLARSLAEQRTEADRVLQAIRGALHEDAALLVKGEAEEIEAAMNRLETAGAGTDHKVIRSRIEELDEATRAFAGRRMDRSMKAALAGRSVVDVAEETSSAKGVDAHVAEHAARAEKR